jgi:hypothetical protein
MKPSKVLLAGAPALAAIAWQGLHAPVQAQTPISVRLNGNPVTFREAAPAKISGKVLVPMRDVFSVMQANVSYDAGTRTITAKRAGTEIQLQLGSTQATRNGQALTLAQPAQLIGGSTFVPLRFVADALGAQVDWNEASQTVFITDPSLGQVTNTPTNPNPQPVRNANEVVGVVQRVDAQAPARIVVREGQQVRAYDLAGNVNVFRQSTGSSGAGNPAFGPRVPIELEGIAPNEEVALTLNAQNQVTQIAVQSILQTARVRSVRGNQVVLDNGLVVTVSNVLRYLNAQGQAGTAIDVRPGDAVAVFLRPSTNAVYQISASETDVAAAGAVSALNTTPGTTNPNPTNPNTTPATNLPPGTPQVQLVQHNALQALRTGATINVTVRGTPNLRGVFDISPRLQNVPLQQTQPGVYRGTYVVKAGDDVLNGRITARLSNENGQEDAAQSEAPITIDTVAPREIRVVPAEGSIVTDARPTITVTVDDVGGSGLAAADLTLTPQGGQSIRVPATIVPPSTITAQSPQALSGRISAKLNFSDAARNSRSIFFNFTVQPRQGAIRSVNHNATRPLRQGDTLRVDILAEPAGRATFDLIDALTNQAVVNRIPMTELNVGDGRYQGSYTVPQALNAERLRIRARFEDGAGAADTSESLNEVLLVRNAGNTGNALTITQPTNGAAATSPLQVRGRATPNALVDVTITARGTKTLLGILGYQAYEQVVDTQQVQADAAGNWQLRNVPLTRPRNIANLQYEISAVQTEIGNQRSEPVTVTLAAAQ